jgi:hypothetical protein
MKVSNSSFRLVNEAAASEISQLHAFSQVIFEATSYILFILTFMFRKIIHQLNGKLTNKA